MDSFYNKEMAVKVLDEIIAERMQTSTSPQMYGMDMQMVDKFALSIGKDDSDVASKLIQQNEDTGETEEATVALQGIISSCLLPPFETKNGRLDDIKRLSHSRQSITLTGLGSIAFNQMIANCRQTYSMFSRYTPNAKLVPVPEFIGKDNSLSDNSSRNLTITASNRFFTPVKQAAGLTAVDIPAELDPRGILEKVDKTKWLHTEDNLVGYYVLGSGDDEGRYKPTTPIIFQVGDIVELQVSLICIPSKGNYTVKVVLRSIVLLNGELTTEATTARTLAVDTRSISTMPPRRLKRRNPYAGTAKSRKDKKDGEYSQLNIEQGTEEGAGQELSNDALMENAA